MYRLKSSAGVLLLAAIPVFGQGLQERGPVRDPWRGFEAGSWAILREKKASNGKVSVTKFKTLIVKFDGDTPIFARIGEVNGQFGEAEYAYHYQGASVKYIVEVDDFAKEVSIGDRKLSCVQERIVFEENT